MRKVKGSCSDKERNLLLDAWCCLTLICFPVQDTTNQMSVALANFCCLGWNFACCVPLSNLSLSFPPLFIYLFLISIKVQNWMLQNSPVFQEHNNGESVFSHRAAASPHLHWENRERKKILFLWNTLFSIFYLAWKKNVFQHRWCTLLSGVVVAEDSNVHVKCTALNAKG